MRVRQPRAIYLQGRRTLLYFYEAIFGLGAFFVAVVMAHVSGTLLAPLDRLSRAVSSLKSGREEKGVGFSGRLDELGTLAQAVNGMLVQIVGNRKAQEELSSESTMGARRAELRHFLLVASGDLTNLVREVQERLLQVCGRAAQWRRS